MASFIRRIQRTVFPSRLHYEPGPHGDEGENVINPPRNVHYLGRGARLGVRNKSAADLLARQAREAKRKHG